MVTRSTACAPGRLRLRTSSASISSWQWSTTIWPGWRLCGAKAEVDLLLRRYGLGCDVVPDPYYGEADGFDNVLNLIEEASDALLAEIKGRL